jgi:hypothetical protein
MEKEPSGLRGREDAGNVTAPRNENPKKHEKKNGNTGTTWHGQQDIA